MQSKTGRAAKSAPKEGSQTKKGDDGNNDEGKQLYIYTSWSLFENNIFKAHSKATDFIVLNWQRNYRQPSGPPAIMSGGSVRNKEIALRCARLTTTLKRPALAKRQLASSNIRGSAGVVAPTCAARAGSLPVAVLAGRNLAVSASPSPG